MRSSFLPSAVLALVALSACSEQPVDPGSEQQPAFASKQQPATPGVTGRHIVSFTGHPPADFAQRVAALGGKVEWVRSGAGMATVSGLSASAAARLGKESGVASVNGDLSFRIEQPTISQSPRSTQRRPHSPGAPSTAFFYQLGLQWNMDAVHADEAWAAGKVGSSDVSVFILDTGIDYLHLDLIGLVDLNRSTDLLGTFDVDGVPFTEADTVAKYFPGRLPFTDLFFHGTHVGSTVSSNAFVAAGVTSRTTLVAVKVCAYLNTCPFSSVLDGVLYAADHGADVINMSLGGDFVKAGNGRFVGLINKTFNYARSKGVTIVVSAGNAAEDLDHNGNIQTDYCDNPAVICVSATGPASQASDFGPFTDVDAFAYYSNFGRSAINVAAPGGNNDSFVWAACSQTSLLIDCSASPTFVVGAQGTSMASPHVAGTAALLVAELGDQPGQIKSRIQKGADDLGKPGTDPFYGKGRLNVPGALGL
jgi:lantibiotic leader peptide-processing serine protease